MNEEHQANCVTNEAMHNTAATNMLLSLSMFNVIKPQAAILVGSVPES